MQLTWLINRFSKMPLKEIPWRILEKAKKISEKNHSFQKRISYKPLDEKIFQLSDKLDPSQISSLFPERDNYPFSVADNALLNHFNAFGYYLDFHDDIDWSFDPVSGKPWPIVFWGDINYRDSDYGGVKFVWEYNRLYFLFPLALSYFITSQKKYADKVLDLLNSWVSGNPYPIGVNWASGIECGVRLANLIWSLSLMKDYPFSENNYSTINSFVYYNAYRLDRYPSKYSSSNNHLLAEGFGLFIAGLFFSHLKGAGEWFKSGKQIMEREVTRQILADGGSFEYTTTYLSFVFDFFLLFKICCDTYGISYSKVVDERLEKSCSFINTLIDKNGNMPNIGDQDSAVLIDFGCSNQENFQSILNTGSVLFNRHNLDSYNIPDLKTYMLTGITPQASRISSPSSLVAIQFKDSGISVIKESTDDMELIFYGNATPLGLAPLYAHGHLDALSFALNIEGLEFFVDPGTYLYHSGGKWREYFRGTSAHNTIRINACELSKQTGDFMFGTPYRITGHRLEKKNGLIIWEASHDAYQNNYCANIERQVIWNSKGGKFDINDHIDASNPFLIESFFHCHPNCIVKQDSGFVCINRDEIKINLYYDPTLKIKIMCGSKEPIAGWYSHSFNKLCKSNTIRLSGNFKKSKSFTTSIEINNYREKLLK